MHHKEEFKVDSTIFKPYHISYHKARVNILSGLQVMQRDYPISSQTITQSKAHIPEPLVGVFQIPRDNVAEEGGDTEKEIEHFTSVLEDTTQPSSQARA